MRPEMWALGGLNIIQNCTASAGEREGRGGGCKRVIIAGYSVSTYSSVLLKINIKNNTVSSMTCRRKTYRDTLWWGSNGF
jgi:hypothetical protein